MSDSSASGKTSKKSLSNPQNANSSGEESDLISLQKPPQTLTILQKCTAVNKDPSIYGTFAEIGAGQEVARYFFQAGRASATIAKTMSAYDMTFSDAIYGKEESGRYVCQSRVLKMLDHEFKLLQQRLGEKRGKDTRFFVFADTVAGKTKSNKSNCHAWLGVRFQKTPESEPNDLVIHIRMLDERRLHQQQVLGIIGVNLVHCAFNYTTLEKSDQIVDALHDNIEPGRMEIDMIRLIGPDLKEIRSRIMSLDLVKKDMTPAVMFNTKGKVVQPSDELFCRPIFLQRGAFRPVTTTNMDIQIQGLNQFLEEPGVKGNTPIVAMEMTTQDLRIDGVINNRDFLNRVDTLSLLDQTVIITDAARYWELKSTLRIYTQQLIGIVIGAAALNRIFDEKYYEDLEGGLLQGMGRLFDDQTRFYVFPQMIDGQIVTAETYQPKPEIADLYQYLLKKRNIVDIKGVASAATATTAEDVRKLMNAGNPEWEKMVPKSVVQLIKEKGFFGYSKN